MNEISYYILNEWKLPDTTPNTIVKKTKTEEKRKNSKQCECGQIVFFDEEKCALCYKPLLTNYEKRIEKRVIKDFMVKLDGKPKYYYDEIVAKYNLPRGNSDPMCLVNIIDRNNLPRRIHKRSK